MNFCLLNKEMLLHNYSMYCGILLKQISVKLNLVQRPLLFPSSYLLFVSYRRNSYNPAARHFSFPLTLDRKLFDLFIYFQ